MSNVLETRNRLILEYLEKLADQLSGGKSIASATLEEQTVRLLASVVMLLRQHRVNKRGQCRFCGWQVKTWRFWRRRPPCAVYRSLSFAMGQKIDAVWWQLFESLGRLTSLEEVRKWVAERERAVRRPSQG